MSLFDKGIVMPQKIAAAIGMKPHKFRKHMEESKAMDFMSTLTPPMVEETAQMLKVNPALGAMPTSPSTKPKPSSKSKGKEGAPRKKPSELSEEGQETRDNATNVGRGGKSFAEEEEINDDTN
jgi:hypothetical protein